MKEYNCKLCGEKDSSKFYGVSKTKCYECTKKDQLVKYYINAEYFRKYQLKYYDENLISIRYLAAKYRAGKKNIEFNITKENLTSLLEKQNNRCPYTKNEFTNSRDKLYSWSIDRIDSTKGYTLDNVELVSSIINDAKKQMNKKDFIDLVKLVAKNMENI